jgi:pyridoxine kinase
MQRQKRVAAIHDISCFGRCSLTVALPIISAAGIECSVVPTAVLSTHTGGFSGFTYRDLTEDIIPVAEHWQSLSLNFDALYTGFLGSFEQINIMIDFFDRFKTPGNLILVDPVMADNGELYKIFPADFPAGMRKLCKKADIIVPNITEAALLLDEPYREGPYSREYIKSQIKKLASLGSRQVVLTGVFFNGQELGSAAYDKATGEIHYTMARRVEGLYHGTGDVYGSVLLSALVNGRSLAQASEMAVDFTVKSIRRTKEAGTDIRYGVNFEAGLCELGNRFLSEYK